MSIPHQSWAHLYDFVYQNEFGSAYEKLTDDTLTVIRSMCTFPCRVVDFGAGTGRLTIPLVMHDGRVWAVDPCREMMQVLFENAISQSPKSVIFIRPCVQSIQEFDACYRGCFDLALCVFSTISYLLDEDSLWQGLSRLASSLDEGGQLLIDVPRKTVFRSRECHTPVLDRQVTITPYSGDTYAYRDEGRCRINDRWVTYGDEFRIRYWPSEMVLDILRRVGIDTEGPLAGFGWTHSDYYKGKKI